MHQKCSYDTPVLYLNTGTDNGYTIALNYVNRCIKNTAWLYLITETDAGYIRALKRQSNRVLFCILGSLKLNKCF